MLVGKYLFYLLLHLNFLTKCSCGTYGMKDYRFTHCWCTLCTSYPWHLLVHTMHIIPITSAGAHYAQCHNHDICWYTLRTMSYLWHLLVHIMHLIPMTFASAHYAQCHNHDICWYTLRTMSYLWHLLVHTMHLIPMTFASAHYACHIRDRCWCTLRTTSYPWPLHVTPDTVINAVASIADLILQCTKKKKEL